MKRLLLGLGFIALLVGPVAPVAAQKQSGGAYSYPHLTPEKHRYYAAHPDEWQKVLENLPRVSSAVPAAQRPAPKFGSLVSAPPIAPATSPGTFTPITHPASVPLGNPILLTDGTIMAVNEANCDGTWYRYTPDWASGFNAYLNGTWSRMSAQPQSGYAPRFFASAVLPDGRVIIEGGEYNGAGCPNSSDTGLGALYDPIANTWTAITKPSGWSYIGDGGGIVLPNGVYMQTPCCSAGPTAALFNPVTLGWTSTGTGKADAYEEESLALLPDDRVLTVNSYWSLGGCTALSGQNAQTYNYSTGAWSAAGTTTTQQADCSNLKTYEIGPLMMSQWGSAFNFPGLTTGNYGNVNVFDPVANTWSTASLMPSQLDKNNNNVPYTMADAPGAVLPNGNMLVAMSPGNWVNASSFPTPTHFWEYSPGLDGFTQTADTSTGSNYNSYEHNFVVLPSGQVMVFNIDAVDIELYSTNRNFQQAWQPTVTSLPTCVSIGGSFQVNGTQLNGLTEGGYYGDDAQATTNFPIALLIASDGSQYIAPTFAHGSRSIAPNKASWTSFTVPSMPTGSALFYIIASGIPSAGTQVEVKSTCAQTATHDFDANGKSDILWHSNLGDVSMWFMNGTTRQSSAGVATINTSWQIVGAHNGAADFNGDGHSDILWHATDGSLAMWLMNGSTISSGSGMGSVDPAWQIAGIGDFNGDGKSDILWQSNGGSLAIWFMNGTSISSSAGVATIPVSWQVAAIGDLNGDGKADIVLRNGGSGDVAVWLMNGATIASGAGLGVLPSAWQIVGAGDFNGDGKSDILWRHSGGSLAMWYMNGTSVAASGSAGVVDTAWSVASTGDYDGNGKADILWRSSGGDAAMWLMNGTTISSSASLGVLPAAWTIVE